MAQVRLFRIRLLPMVACAVLAVTAALAGAGRSAAAGPVADEVHYTFTSETSVTFDWRGSAAAISFGPDATYGTTVAGVHPTPVPFSSSGPFWEARLTGLTPGTTYHYSIGGTADATFRTAPVADYTVVAVGDMLDSATAPWETQLHQLIAQQSPAFVLALGDLTYANENCQPAVDQHFNDAMAWSRTAAYMPVWGNHEYGKVQPDSLPCAVDDYFSNYKGRFDMPHPQTLSIDTATKSNGAGCPLVNGTNPCRGEDWMWFDVGPVRWITGPETWPGSVTEWKAAVAPLMAAAQSDPRFTAIITASHRPAYSSRTEQVNADYRAAIDALGSTYPKYRLHLNGHAHDTEVFTAQQGVVHVTAGGGGAVPVQLPTLQPGSVFFSRHPGFARIDVTGGAVTLRIVCGPDNGRGSDPCASGSTTYGPITVVGTPVNQPPTAVATASCTGLTCSFNGSGSTDPDGTVVGYRWAFGDGTTGSGATVSHTYAASGTYTATLTVTDDDGATGTTTRTVSVAPTGTSPITFVGVRSSNATTLSATVTVPSTVLAGDGLLLAESVASTTVTVGAPTGGTWTLLATQVAGTMVTRFYARPAQAGDAGRTVSVSVSDYAKVDLQLAAYRGTNPTQPVAAIATAADTTSTASHTTPVVSVVDSRSWVVSYWGDKSTSTTAWAVPPSVTTRDVVLGTGSGYLTSVLADSNAAVPAGNYGGITASTDQPATKAVTATIVLAAS